MKYLTGLGLLAALAVALLWRQNGSRRARARKAKENLIAGGQALAAQRAEREGVLAARTLRQEQSRAEKVLRDQKNQK